MLRPITYKHVRTRREVEQTGGNQESDERGFVRHADSRPYIILNEQTQVCLRSNLLATPQDPEKPTQSNPIISGYALLRAPIRVLSAGDYYNGADQRYKGISPE
jgi:hypothetical protein